MILTDIARRFARRPARPSVSRPSPEKPRAKYLPATKIYALYAVPRSLLRAYAQEGKVDTHRVPIPNCRHDMITYSVSDLEKLLNAKQ